MAFYTLSVKGKGYGVSKNIFFILILMMFLSVLINCKNDEFSHVRDLQSFNEISQVAIVPVSYQNLTVDLRRNSNSSPIFNIYKSSKLFGYGSCAIELCKKIKNYIGYKKWLKHLSYHEFMTSFSYLLMVEEQIARIQDLLHKNSHGTFPERVVARIDLVRASLVSPYDKIMNECAQSYLKANFDKFGKLVWYENDDADLHYKNFYKKVPQNFKGLVRCSKKISNKNTYIYVSNIAGKTENVYNQTLLDIIYAGISENFPLLKKLCRTYYDMLFERLYQYYIDQKCIKNRIVDDNFADNSMIVHKDYGMSEEHILQKWYEHEMMNWLCPFQQHNALIQSFMSDFLLGEQILELPLNPNYRFVLLRAFLDKLCFGCQNQSKVSYELFSPCGIFKKYKNHIWVQDKFEAIELHDVVMQKAVNFSLAICEKEQDEITQQVGKRLFQYVFCAYADKDSSTFMYYKNKVVVLYEALSYKRYDLNILKI